MKIILRSLVAFFPIFVLQLSECAKAPEEKLASAREALDNAKADGAAIYAKSEFSCAQDLYYRAFNDIQDEKKRFVFLRNYGNAGKKLDSAILAAQKAVKTAELEKLRIEAEKKLAVERKNSFKAKYLSQGSVAHYQSNQKPPTVANRKPL
jgi:hypothetical protein